MNNWLVGRQLLPTNGFVTRYSMAATLFLTTRRAKPSRSLTAIDAAVVW